MTTERGVGFACLLLGVFSAAYGLATGKVALVAMAVLTLITGIAIVTRSSRAREIYTVCASLMIGIYFHLFQSNLVFRHWLTLGVLVLSIFIVWRVWEPDPKKW